jgi:predicted nuclease of predicted toxin-antitoxin system
MKPRFPMADLSANENFPRPVVESLRRLGHDVLTSLEAGTANQRIPDLQVLAFAAQASRAVLTHNRLDFKRLHRRTPRHAGIIICTEDRDFAALARRIHQRIQAQSSSAGQLISVTRE